MSALTRGMALPGILLASLVIGWPALRLQASQETLQTISAAQNGPVLSLAVDVSDGSLLKAGGGVFRSTDHGASWHPLPIPAALYPDKIRQVTTTGAAPVSVWAAGPGALPGPLGGHDVAQDVNTLVGKPAPAFTLADSEGKRYAVTPGGGRPMVLVFHMGIT